MEYLVKASALLSLFYILHVVFLKKETFFSAIRWYFIVGILSAFCLPLVVFTDYVEVSFNPLESLINTTNVSDISQAKQIETTHIDCEQILWVVYFSGIIVLTIKFFIELLSLKRHINKGILIKDGHYNMVEVSENDEPFSFFNWIVYNPKMYSEEELNQILIHEKSHVDGGHTYDLIISKLTTIIFWFLPLTRWYTKAIKQNLEFISDQKSTSQVHCIKSYQTLLLKQTIPNYKFQLANQFYNSFIKNRIVMLNKTQSSKFRLFKLLLVLPFLALFLMNFSSETQYVYKSEIPKNTLEKNDIVKKRLEIVFSKEYSDKDLERIKKQLKDNGVTLTINKLERNDDDVITAIDVTFKTENGSANYNTTNEKGIGSFVYSMDDDGSFGVKSIDKHPVLAKIIEESDGKVKTKVTTEKVYVYRTDTDSINTSDSKFIIKELDSDEDVDIIVESNDNNNFIIKNNGVVIDSVVVEELLKSKNDVFFEDAKRKKLKVNGNTFIIKSEGALFSNDKDKPLIILNGEVISNSKMKNINPKLIEEVTVLKDSSAVKLYGEKGENGVIVIRTNKDKEAKWVVDDKVFVTSMAYIDDEDEGKNAVIAYISKDTPNAGIEKHKALLKSKGIDTKISKLKRNKNGDITSIKISLKDNKGNKSSASFKNDDGIDTIEFGLSEGGLIVRSK